MQQDAIAGEVLEEPDAEARALRGALYQPGDIRHHETAVGLHLDHAQVGHQGGEGVVGHLGGGGGHRADKRGLAGVGQAQQADVGQHLQLQLQVALLALAAFAGLPRGAVGAGLEPGIAQAVKASPGHHQALPGDGQVAQHFAGVLVQDGGAHGHFQHQVLAGPAGLVLAAPGLAVLGPEAALEAEVHHGVEIAVGLQDDTAPVAPVTAVGPALGHIFFPPETEAATAAIAGENLDTCLVYEFHVGSVVLPAATKKSPVTDEASIRSAWPCLRRSPPGRICGCWGP